MFKLGNRGAGVRKEHNKKLGKIKVIFMNARSVLNKIDELRILVQEFKPDIIGVTESWSHNNITNA